MSSQLRLALAISTILATATFAGVASAQQTAPSTPAVGAQPAPASGAAAQPRRPNANARRGGNLMRALARLSPADRAAVLDARLAAMKAGLELTPDQQKLWQPVETAIRNNIAQAISLRNEYAGQPRPTDPMQRLTRASEMATARANWLKSFADAAQPLYASLTAEQKARLPMLMGVVNRIGGAGAGARGERGPQDRGQQDRGPQGRGPQERGPGAARGPRGPGAMGSNQGGGSAGTGAGRDGGSRMGDRGGDEGGRQDWRDRMRQRMEEMNQNRNEWRGGSIGPDRDGRGGGGYGQGWRGPDRGGQPSSDDSGNE